MIDPATVTAPTCRIRLWRDDTVTAFATAEPAKRTVAARLFWTGGPATEPPPLAGAHAVTVRSWLRSKLCEQLEFMGLTVTSGVTTTSCHLEVRGPRDQIKPALRRVAVALADEDIDEQAFQTARAQIQYQLERRAHDARLLAGDAFRAARVPSLARPPEGTVETVRRLVRADAVATARNLLRRPPCLLIAGDPDLDAYLGEIGPLTRCVMTGPVTAPAPLLPERPTPLVQLKQAPRRSGYLLWGAVFRAEGAADHVVAELAAHMLGGWAAARWNVLLREELGLTYGAAASTSSISLGGRVYCTSRVGMAVTPDALDKTRDLVLDQAARFIAHGPEPEELRQAAVQLLRSEAHFHDSARKLMTRTASFVEANLDADFAWERMSALRQLDPDAFRARLKELMCQTTLVTVAA